VASTAACRFADCKEEAIDLLKRAACSVATMQIVEALRAKRTEPLLFLVVWAFAFQTDLTSALHSGSG
jgi:hypothetical protein